jgi:hypothetical protein
VQFGTHLYLMRLQNFLSSIDRINVLGTSAHINETQPTLSDDIQTSSEVLNHKRAIYERRQIMNWCYCPVAPSSIGGGDWLSRGSG